MCAYLYKDAFARVSTVKYSLRDDGSFVEDLAVHLTNTSIQRKCGTGRLAKDVASGGGQEGVGSGTKLQLFPVLEEVVKQYRREAAPERAEQTTVASVWHAIRNVVIGALSAVSPQIKPRRSCFEVFGFDVVLDSDLRPWLLEVNASPSLEPDSTMDADIKLRMVMDTLRIVMPPLYNRRALYKLLEEAVSSNWVYMDTKNFLARLADVLEEVEFLADANEQGHGRSGQPGRGASAAKRGGLASGKKAATAAILPSGSL